MDGCAGSFELGWTPTRMLKPERLKSEQEIKGYGFTLPSIHDRAGLWTRDAHGLPSILYE
eukprot:2854640-Prymnesium_polylepis.2